MPVSYNMENVSLHRQDTSRGGYYSFLNFESFNALQPDSKEKKLVNGSDNNKTCKRLPHDVNQNDKIPALQRRSAYRSGASCYELFEILQNEKRDPAEKCFNALKHWIQYTETVQSVVPSKNCAPEVGLQTKKKLVYMDRKDFASSGWFGEFECSDSETEGEEEIICEHNEYFTGSDETLNTTKTLTNNFLTLPRHLESEHPDVSEDGYDSEEHQHLPAPAHNLNRREKQSVASRKNHILPTTIENTLSTAVNSLHQSVEYYKNSYYNEREQNATLQRQLEEEKKKNEELQAFIKDLIASKTNLVEKTATELNRLNTLLQTSQIVE